MSEYQSKIFTSTEQEREFGRARKREVFNARSLFDVLREVGYEIPPKEIQDRIKVYLGQQINESFSRCRSRSSRRALLLAKQGDPSHLREGHICDKCHCHRVAGWGTLGDYGFGYNAGHYGRGLCGVHELAPDNSGKAEAITRVHTEVLKQGKDFTYDATGNHWLQKVQRDSELASERISLYAEVDIMRATMAELQERCRVGNDIPEPIVNAMADLEEIKKNLVAHDEESDLDLVKDKIDRLSELLYQSFALTESAKGGPGPMSTETRILLTARLGDVIGRLSFNQSRLDISSYVHLDYVKTWLQAIWRCTRETLHLNPEQEKAWLDQMARIVQPPTGKKL